MPRGVPASGKRRTRAVFAAEASEAPVAAGAVDDAAREPETAPAEVELVAPAAPVLTPEQQEIQLLREQVAKLLLEKDLESKPAAVRSEAKPGDKIRIHFLEDGLSALGKVWYRGEELEFIVGSRPYEDTFNRRGETWLDLRLDEFKQVDRFGKIMFREGPWPGKTYLDGTFEALRKEKGEGFVEPPSPEQLKAAEKRRQRRAAPSLPELEMAESEA